MSNETPEERIATVESILSDTHRMYRELKDSRMSGGDRGSRSTFDMNTGKIRVLRLVLDTFAEAGFEINKEARDERQSN